MRLDYCYYSTVWWLTSAVYYFFPRLRHVVVEHSYSSSYDFFLLVHHLPAVQITFNIDGRTLYDGQLVLEGGLSYTTQLKGRVVFSDFCR